MKYAGGNAAGWVGVFGSLVGCLMGGGCSGGVNDPAGLQAPPASLEPLPEQVSTIGFAPASVLRDPVTGAKVFPSEVALTGAFVPGIGPLFLLAFSTSAAADDAAAGGPGNLEPLDREAPPDANLTLDVFLAAVDGDGAVKDVVLVSRALGSGAGNGRSGSPSLLYVAAEDQAAPSSSATNFAGSVFVAFDSDASDLVAPDDGGRDVFRAEILVFADQDPANGASAIGSVDLRWMATTLVSVDTSGGGADAPSMRPSIGAAGRRVVFQSQAQDVVAGFVDRNGTTATDVFVRDIDLARTRLVSRTVDLSNGGNGNSERPVLAGKDGEVVVFESDADDLVADDRNARRDVFLARFGPALGLLELARASVSSAGAEGVAGDSRRADAHVSATGRILVAFESDASGLVPEVDGMTVTNVYLREHGGGTLLLNQRNAANGRLVPGRAAGGRAPADSFAPSFSDDGSSVAFHTLADDLDILRPADRNGVADVVVADVSGAFATGELRVRRLSVTFDGCDGNGDSTRALFASLGKDDVLLRPSTASFRRLLAGAFMHERCVNCHGANTPDPADSTLNRLLTPLGPAQHPGGLPPSGGFPNFDSCQQTGCHTPSIHEIPSPGFWRAPFGLDFRNKSIDELCRMAASIPPPPSDSSTPKEHLQGSDFVTWAFAVARVPSGEIKPKPLGGDFTGWRERVEAWVAGGMVCNDFGSGRLEFVAFETDASNLGASPASRNVIGILQGAALERISKTSGLAPTGGRQLRRPSHGAAMTIDDRYVAFVTDEALDPNDRNRVSDVYVRDRLRERTFLISRAATSALAAGAGSRSPSVALAPDGHLLVAFESLAIDLVSGFVDGNGPNATDVYLAEVAASDGNPDSITLALVSAAGGSGNRGGSGGSANARVSGGEAPRVVFESTAGDLVPGFADGNGSGRDIYLWAGAGSVALVSAHRDGPPTQGANGDSAHPVVAGAGAEIWVAFDSAATDLVPGFVPSPRPETRNVFLRATVGPASAQLVSRSARGGVLAGGLGSSEWPSLALEEDGPVVAFESQALDLVAGFLDRSPLTPDVFVHRPRTGAMELVSASPPVPGAGGNGGSYRPRLSADGRRVAFYSAATDLVSAADTNRVFDVFLHDRIRNETRLMSANALGGAADGISRGPDVGTGSSVVFESQAGDLTEGGVDSNGVLDIYRSQV